MRRDWPTADFPGRDEAMWKLVSDDVASSFPGGGTPMVVTPFRQDDREIFKLTDFGISAASELREAEVESVTIVSEGGSYRIHGSHAEKIESKIYIDDIGLGRKNYKVEGARLLEAEDQTYEPILLAGQDALPDSNVRAIALSPDNELYVATPSGIGILNMEGIWRHLTGKEGGLPINDVTSLSFASDGTLWVGTAVGAARRSPEGQWNYRMGPRWMVGDRVVDVAATDEGGAWILTDESLTHLFTRTMTLRQKAQTYDETTRKRHVRRGAVGECYFRHPGDPESWMMTDNDNDGLWTSIYTAAKCFEYGATKDPAALRIAKQHFAFLERLENINGYPGYIARSIRPLDYDPDGHEQYHYHGLGKWIDSDSEPGWSWKSDTSSDELIGHFFVWGVYYDLIAKGNPKEETRVRNLVRRVTNRLVDHDFNIVDEDGVPTRWGVYDPKMLNGDLLWSDAMGLNALLILAHLKVAIHICGDQKFKDAYTNLIEKYGYGAKAMLAKEMIPNVPNGGVNHSDDEMAWMAYYHLLLYPDDDPKLEWQYRYSAVRSMRTLVPEKSPLYNFVFGVEFPEWAHVNDGVETLEQWPLDLRHWRTRNSQRDDVIINPQLTREHEKTLITPVKIDERVPSKWSMNPYIADAGDEDGRTEEDGGSWLLPYWLGIYHGLILECDD